MSDYVEGILLGFCSACACWLVRDCIILAKARISSAKPKKPRKGDWWKRGERPPWEKD